MTTPPSTRFGSDLSDTMLRRMALASVVCALAWVLVRPWLPDVWRSVGSLPLYICGVLGLTLLLVPAVFAWNKRMASQHPRLWFMAHIVCAVWGWLLIVVHMGGKWLTPPFLLFVILTLLMVLGLWGRMRAVRLSAGTFGTKISGFQPPNPQTRAQLQALIVQKTQLLAVLDPDTKEGTFSVSLRHALRAPRMAWRYWRFQKQEQALIGTRSAVSRPQGWWRALHMLLGWCFMLGAMGHVVLVTFFAGYLSGYGRMPITWWHITAW